MGSICPLVLNKKIKQMRVKLENHINSVELTCLFA
jgi:hypothetical protein